MLELQVWQSPSCLSTWLFVGLWLLGMREGKKGLIPSFLLLFFGFQQASCPLLLLKHAPVSITQASTSNAHPFLEQCPGPAHTCFQHEQIQPPCACLTGISVSHYPTLTWVPAPWGSFSELRGNSTHRVVPPSGSSVFFVSPVWRMTAVSYGVTSMIFWCFHFAFSVT